MKKLLILLLVLLPVFKQAQSDVQLVKARVAHISTRLENLHPRLLLRPADLPALRQFLKALPAQPDGAALAKLALPALDNKTLIAEPHAVRSGTPENTRLWRAGYEAANETGVWAQRYALAWLISENPAYGREAARWLMHLASWTIDRETYRTNDELFIQSLRPMLFAYDWAYGALTANERAVVSAALIARMTVLAAQVQPKFKLTRATPADNNLSHPMRFISTLGQGGLVLYHEAKDAPGWLAWSYEYYQHQFPVWGGPDGGWAEGLSYWASGLSQHQRFLEGMALLGFDASLQRPFWRNTAYFGVYGLMPYPGSSFGDLNNIIAPSGSIALMLEKFAVANADPYPLVFARTLQQKPPSDFGYYNYDAIDSLLQAFRSSQARLPEAALADLPQSRHFADVGVVSMHSALGDAARDIMFGFRSSPQGTASHAFADQNSFVLNAFGEPLAINSGYREFYDSPHHQGWTRQTKAKNAILFGGAGQRVKDDTATGTITRYVDGSHFTYVTGDAKRAYGPIAERALRHVFFVGRRYFVILDEVAAPEAVNVQWQLHARSPMTLAPERNEVTQSQGDARLTVRFVAPGPGALSFSQTDAFDPPVLAGYAAKMPNEWHFTAETIARKRRQDFLTLLYPWHASESRVLPASQGMHAAKGHAMRLSGQDGEDIVLMARDEEKEVRAGEWSLVGVAASIETRDDSLRFTLIETTRLNGPFAVQASQPISLEGERSAQGLSVRVRLSYPTSLQLTPGFRVTSVSGIKTWRQEEDGRVMLELPAGLVALSLKP